MEIIISCALICIVVFYQLLILELIMFSRLLFVAGAVSSPSSIFFSEQYFTLSFL